MGETDVCLYNNDLKALKGMERYESKLWITVVRFIPYFFK